VHAGYPLDVEALLIVELDGGRAEVDHLIATPPVGYRRTRTSGSCSGPGARPRSPPPAVSRLTICAWTAPFRARPCRSCFRACAR
jgi:hypothetical protein